MEEDGCSVCAIAEVLSCKNAWTSYSLDLLIVSRNMTIAFGWGDDIIAGNVSCELEFHRRRKKKKEP